MQRVNILSFLVQGLSKLLGVSEAEIEHVLSQVELYTQITSSSRPRTHVRFDAESVTHISTFLDCFTCNLHVSEQDSQSGTSAISLVKDLSEDKKLLLGKNIAY